MDSIALIVTALGAGASSSGFGALKDGARERAVAADRSLRDLVKRRFDGNSGAMLMLAEHQAHPGIFGALLAQKLAETGAANDADVLSAATALMELVDQQGTR